MHVSFVCPFVLLRLADGVRGSVVRGGGMDRIGELEL